MRFNRRAFLMSASAALVSAGRARAKAPILLKTIPSTGETVPALGMGSWLTFDVGGDLAARQVREDVLRAFFEAGGRLIDSSPMYGTSQAVIGDALEALRRTNDCFAADKVWTPGGENGPAQIERTRARWGVKQFDLLQVHNLVSWRDHLKTLFAMKAEGRLRYVGVTSYAGLRYSEIEAIMKSEPIDFVQITYNIADREAEDRLLPLAQERKIAVIANRPFREGGLFSYVEGKSLPDFSAEIGVAGWAQFMLKFVISHPALTCAIPATRRADHMRENMASLIGPPPDAAMRRKMAEAFDAL